MLDFVDTKDDGSGGDNLGYKTCKAPVKQQTNHHPTFTGRMPFLSSTNSVKAL